MTYSATIHTSSDWFAVMSAKNDPKAKRNGEYSFVMPEAMPPYLIALAVGDLRFKEIGPRTGVYAEKIDAVGGRRGIRRRRTPAASGREAVRTVSLGSLDLLVLPPSFPVGGMENPRLSFISPTVIAGDKSLDVGHRRTNWRIPGREIW